MASHKDYLPTREAELINFLVNLYTILSAAPTDYGLTAGQMTTWGALWTSYKSSYDVAIEPSTRTRGTVQTKRDNKISCIAGLRPLVRIIQAAPGVTNEQRINLGLHVRDTTPSPINPPTEPPVMQVVSVVGRLMKIKLQGLGSDSRAKPEGVQGATVMSYVGATPPADISMWRLDGQTTRTTFEVQFPASVAAGSQVWLCAAWYSPRGQMGPACQPITAFIAGGVAAAA